MTRTTLPLPQPSPPPPAVLYIKLRLRFRTYPMSWKFCRYAPVQYQLDSALLNFQDGFDGHEFRDAVGILVNGKLYVDDEPYWRNLLVSGNTYDVVYLRRPFWKQPWTWLYDTFSGTPLHDKRKGIPGRAQRFTTKNAYERLVADGSIDPSEPRPCKYGTVFRSINNKRRAKEMERARVEGRWTDYERMMLLGGHGLQEG